MRLEGVSLTLSAGQLSDLFFNFEHPERDKLYAGIDPKSAGDDWDYEAERNAIKNDATEFAMVLGIAHEHREEFAAALVDDFLRRV